MENTTKCPCCPNHCDKESLRCGRGMAHFNIQPAGGGHAHGEKHHGHGHTRPEFPAGSLAELMAKCSHCLFHGGDKTMFNVLTEAETASLTALLTKIASA